MEPELRNQPINSHPYNLRSSKSFTFSRFRTLNTCAKYLFIRKEYIIDDSISISIHTITNKIDLLSHDIT